MSKDNLNTEYVEVECNAFNNIELGIDKFKALIFILLGYGYVLLSFLAITSLGVLIALYFFGESTKTYLIIPVIGTIFVLRRALLVRIPEPSGLNIEKDDAEELFKLIEEVCAITKSKMVHRVILNDEFNVSIAQVPRLGIFGGHRRYLILGVPFMMTLSTTELKSVLAHEFGHFSKCQGRIEGLIYKNRETWLRVMEAVNGIEGNRSFSLKLFLSWYVPKLMKITSSLGRRAEYNADIFSKMVVGEETAGRTLLKLEIKGWYLGDRFWREVYNRASQISYPPEDVYLEMEKALSLSIKEEDINKCLSGALKIETTDDDINPSLRNRLRVLGAKEEYNEGNEKSSARELLGENFLELIDKFNIEWKENNRESWNERYSVVVEGSKRLIEINNVQRERELSKEEKWERCYLTEGLEGSKATFALYMDFLKEYPDFLPANFAVGRLYLEEKSSEGIEYIEKAMDGDEDYIIDGCRLIHSYYLFKGEQEAANKYYIRAIEFSEILEKAERERNLLEFNAEYLPHKLSDEEIKELVIQLSAYPEIEEAYLVRKKVKHFQNKPLYALGIVVNLPWYSFKRTYRRFVERVAGETVFAGETLVAYLNEDNSRLKKIMSRIPDSKIYSNKK